MAKVDMETDAVVGDHSDGVFGGDGVGGCGN